MKGERRLAWPARVHDAITLVGYIGAVVCLVVIVSAYSYEVGARYFFAAPTTWASSLVSYMLVLMVFLVMPELTRARSHIFISILLDSMPARRALWFQRVTFVVAAFACLLASWFCFDATVQQFMRGISTVNEWGMPKWLLSWAIPYGLFSASIYFLRHAATLTSYQTSEAV
ncbi:TRAP transporter small permease [Amorphus sp. 3PC139-8]|uniref:TRAP transporter small permease n=1 Tax=Amorphus sp. 3PC139-8 TaxID=2735676 RepID=UPI00345D48E3